MDKNQTEIYGEFTYSESLTYYELLDIEKFLIEQIDLLFLDAGAAHLDFTPLGDILMMQCAFECRNLEILRDVADEIAGILPDGVNGRLLCLEKNLASYSLFWLSGGQWQEKDYTLPAKGPDDAPVHQVERIPREKTEELPEAESKNLPHLVGTGRYGAAMENEPSGSTSAETNFAASGNDTQAENIAPGSDKKTYARECHNELNENKQSEDQFTSTIEKPELAKSVLTTMQQLWKKLD